jgi:hypothetical protein
MSPNHEATFTPIPHNQRTFVLVPPPNCAASVVLRPVGIEDGHRIYAWWAVAGRCGEDYTEVSFALDSTPMVRFDIPKEIDLDASYLEPFLKKFVAANFPGEERPDKPPIIKNRPPGT